MGWYTVTKTINGKKYLYLQMTYRDGGRVKTKNKYLGPATGGLGSSAPTDLPIATSRNESNNLDDLTIAFHRSLNEYAKKREAARNRLAILPTSDPACIKAVDDVEHYDKLIANLCNRSEVLGIDINGSPPPRRPATIRRKKPKLLALHNRGAHMRYAAEQARELLDTLKEKKKANIDTTGTREHLRLLKRAFKLGYGKTLKAR